MIPKNRELFSDLSVFESLFFQPEEHPWRALYAMIQYMDACAGDIHMDPPLMSTLAWPEDLLCFNFDNKGSSTLRSHMTVERPLHVRGGENLKSDPNVYVRGPVVFGRDVTLRKGAVVTGPSYVGNGVIIGQGCRVKNSIIREQSEICFGTRVSFAIIGNCVRIGEQAVLSDQPLNDNPVAYPDDGICPTYPSGLDANIHNLGLVAGDGCQVGGGAIFASGVILRPGTIVREGMRLLRSAVYTDTVSRDHL